MGTQKRESQAARPPLERMLKIHSELREGHYPNASRLASLLEVTTKTVYRDIEFMRSRMSLPISYDDQRFGYFYTEQVNAFPSMQISEGEIFALVLAEKALQQYRGTTFERPLLSALRKIQEALPDTISLSLGDVERTISFRTSAEPVVDLQIFDQLAKATAARRQLTLMYRKPGLRQPEQRVVDPYHLANINGEWFLFAYDHLRKDIRTFVPARIKAMAETGKTFPRPARFSLESRLRHSFGVHSAEGEFRVVLRFSVRVADYIREKKWHDSQELRELKNGEVELRLRLSSLREVERWVLSWGGDAIVVEPAELARQVKQAAGRIESSH